jgi:hypothetical protein
MTEFAQNMTALAAVLVGAAKMIEAITTCIKPFQKSEAINSQAPKVWWRRIGWEGWWLISRLVIVMAGLLYGMYQLMQLSRSSAPITTGDAANLAIYMLLIVLGFYPPASLDPKGPR